MAPTPKRLDSVEIFNKTKEPAEVTVLFDQNISETHTIPAGASFHFVEKTVDMGSWTAVAPVKEIKASHSNKVHGFIPGVGGIVKKLAVNLDAAGLQAGASE
eukprot:CAMPEP_0202900876 /NCGR_PEP_ID=MMETSP1392-20130828/12082_1 /ASSEMBLY_ACC=CAM_ASM_000868 /TAXON_ID=225041 /ORGANISM="Chlamydomonas chlamydogama, Strain SAG 11-48b" /LENGTH=101 /DNA_ID=CAMNT_0049587333 /DNA_START=180 /DNA_END=485 /DNA_ORIENTATION=-